MRKLIPAVAAAIVLSGLASPVLAAERGAPPAPPADRATARNERYRPTGRLQVRFKDGVPARRRDAALAAVTARGLTVRVERRVAALNAAVLKVSDARAVQALLREHPDVAYVEAESRYLPFQVEPGPSAAQLAEIGADTVHAAATPNTGAGTQIAILDSPVDSTIPDLDDGKVVFSEDYTTPVPDVVDEACTAGACPHGTAVASAAAASAGDGFLTGVAPDAQIRSYNVFRRYFEAGPGNATYEYVGASSADIADALTDVAAHAADNPIVAVNLSLGGPFDNRLVREAIELLHTTAPDVTIVVAAGNDGAERPNFPAGDPHVISVGATGQVTDGSCEVPAAQDAPWTVAAFSNRGKVDVVAPGHCVDVWYSDANEFGSHTENMVPMRSSGTSFAAPMVAGVAALLASAAEPVKGDAARAAILAGAAHPATPNVNVGVGPVKAPASLALAAGSTPYTALTLDRGGQVAAEVGRRTYEVLRVDPTGGTPTAPKPTVSSGFGTVSTGTTTAAPGLARRTGTFAVPVTPKTGSFRLTAAGGTGGADTAVVPLKMLDAANNLEGLPAANGEQGSVPLTYGTRSAYIRSAAVRNDGVIEWDFTYGEADNDPELLPSSDLFVWEPAAPGETADAAMEPTWQEAANTMESNGGVVAGAPMCAYLGNDQYSVCNPGRYLVGFVTFSPEDNSDATTRYKLRLTYTGPTASASAPSLASTSSVTGPFTVTWGGSRAVRWDVWYGVRTLSGSSWSVREWKLWKSKTTARSAVFGSGSSPTAVSPGTTYHFRVRAYDSLGNPSFGKLDYTVAALDDRSSAISYSSGWTSVAASTRWRRTARKTSTAGARASLRTYASAFTIVGDKCSTCGKFKVYLDGVYKGTVDTYYSGATAVRRPLWSSGSLSGGIKPRRVTIIASGTRNRPKVVLDGIAYTR